MHFAFSPYRYCRVNHLVPSVPHGGTISGGVTSHEVIVLLLPIWMNTIRKNNYSYPADLIDIWDQYPQIGGSATSNHDFSEIVFFFMISQNFVRNVHFNS